MALYYLQVFFEMRQVLFFLCTCDEVEGDTIKTPANKAGWGVMMDVFCVAGRYKSPHTF